MVYVSKGRQQQTFLGLFNDSKYLGLLIKFDIIFNFVKVPGIAWVGIALNALAFNSCFVVAIVGHAVSAECEWAHSFCTS